MPDKYCSRLRKYKQFIFKMFGISASLPASRVLSNAGSVLRKKGFYPT